MGVVDISDQADFAGRAPTAIPGLSRATRTGMSGLALGQLPRRKCGATENGRNAGSPLRVRETNAAAAGCAAAGFNVGGRALDGTLCSTTDVAAVVFVPHWPWISACPPQNSSCTRKLVAQPRRAGRPRAGAAPLFVDHSGCSESSDHVVRLTPSRSRLGTAGDLRCWIAKAL